jgi:hypothetical protein
MLKNEHAAYTLKDYNQSNHKDSDKTRNNQEQKSIY